MPNSGSNPTPLLIIDLFDNYLFIYMFTISLSNVFPLRDSLKRAWWKNFFSSHMTLWDQLKTKKGKKNSSRPFEKTLLILGGSSFEHVQLINHLKQSGNHKRNNLNHTEESCFSPIGFHFIECRDEEDVLTGIINVHTITDTCIHRAENLINKFLKNEDTVVLILLDSNKLLSKIFENNDTLALGALPYWIYIMNKTFGSTLNRKQSELLNKGDYLNRKISTKDANHDHSFDLSLSTIIVVSFTETLDYMTNTRVLVHNRTIDTLQQTLRTIALFHECSLYYWNSLSSNEVLHEHIFQMMGIHNASVCDSASFDSLSSIFIPFGWDSINKILAIDKSLNIEALTMSWSRMVVAPIFQTTIAFNDTTPLPILQDYKRFLQKEYQRKIT